LASQFPFMLEQFEDQCQEIWYQSYMCCKQSS